jgi:hypothetical protein
MITGDNGWNSALAGGQKQALYTLEFPSFNLVISSFSTSLVSGMPSGTLPGLIIPEGPSQTIDEVNGTSSISGMEAECIDPANVIKPLVARSNFIGTPALFKLGFAGLAYLEFVLMHTFQVFQTGWNSEGRVTFRLQDPIRYQVYQIFNFGGPGWWAPGEPTPPQPTGPSVGQNSQPISSDNPLWLQGNPINLYLAVMQNFIGLGQNLALPQSQWTIYDAIHDTTLIDPNPYLDVPGILALRNNYFSGDWMEFKITDAQVGKDWVEQQILKPLGLYPLVRANGQLSLKSMKTPPGA